MLDVPTENVKTCRCDTDAMGSPRDLFSYFLSENQFVSFEAISKVAKLHGKINDREEVGTVMKHL